MTTWQYFAIWDEPETSPEVPRGLVRMRPGSDAYCAETLTREGTWRRTSTMVSVRSKGDPAASDVLWSRAREIAIQWYATDRIDDIPQDLRDAPPE